MTDETYVDPNSGAAPQPGGWVGEHGAALGFAGATEGQLEEEPTPAFYEAPGGTGTPGGGFPLSGATGEAQTDEEQADADASVEHQGVSSLSDGTDEGARLPVSNDGNDRAANADADDDADADEDSFDPADHTVEEVQEYIQENPDQEEAVLAAEREGKARKSLVGE